MWRNRDEAKIKASEIECQNKIGNKKSNTISSQMIGWGRGLKNKENELITVCLELKHRMRSQIECLARECYRLLYWNFEMPFNISMAFSMCRIVYDSCKNCPSFYPFQKKLLEIGDVMPTRALFRCIVSRSEKLQVLALELASVKFRESSDSLETCNVANTARNAHVTQIREN